MMIGLLSHSRAVGELGSCLLEKHGGGRNMNFSTGLARLVSPINLPLDNPLTHAYCAG